MKTGSKTINNNNLHEHCKAFAHLNSQAGGGAGDGSDDPRAPIRGAEARRKPYCSDTKLESKWQRQAADLRSACAFAVGDADDSWRDEGSGTSNGIWNQDEFIG